VHRINTQTILAINRGESKKILSVSIQVDNERGKSKVESFILQSFKSNHFLKSNPVQSELLKAACDDAYKRLLYPALSREFRSEKTKEAQEDAIKCFCENLKNLLLTRPVKGQRILGIDPGYRHGTKVASIDETGKLLRTTTLYPLPPQRQVRESNREFQNFIDEGCGIFAVGDGCGSRKMEELLSSLIKERGVQMSYTVVSEAGASVYSTSKIAQKEFPDLDATLRGAVSIARRLQDPLAEIIKIDPKSIGVGMYQHDLTQSKLNAGVADVVEDTVSSVGCDVNTASEELLKHIAGLSPARAKKIVAHRMKNGPFKSRQEILKVKGIGKKSFHQAAGFLTVPGSKNPLDITLVHPESYDAAKALLKKAEAKIQWVGNKEKLEKLEAKLKEFKTEEVAKELEIGFESLSDIIDWLCSPGVDPRDKLDPPILRTSVMTMEELKEGMEVLGEVRNVTPRLAFCNIGVGRDGALHISKIRGRDFSSAGIVIGAKFKMKIENIDLARKRINLSLVNAPNSGVKRKLESNDPNPKRRRIERKAPDPSEVGQIKMARVVKVFGGGAICNIGEFDAFLHKSKVSNHWVNDLREFGIVEGAEFRAKIESIDQRRNQYQISTKDPGLGPDNAGQNVPQKRANGYQDHSRKRRWEDRYW